MSSTKGKPWGKITWYFIHTFCERIDEKFFVENKGKVFSVLSNVCSMIPCPTCRAHALQYLKKNPLIKIVRNKDDLKAYFFRFHNHATLNGNSRMIPAEQSVLDMYKRANFPLIAKAFSDEYMRKTPTRQDYTHTMYSQRILKDTLNFVYANQRYFAPEAVANAPEAVANTPEITMTIVE